jgi:krueppel-like factor 15
MDDGDRRRGLFDGPDACGPAASEGDWAGVVGHEVPRGTPACREHGGDLALIGGDFALIGGDFALIGGDFALTGGDFALLRGDFALTGGDFGGWERPAEEAIPPHVPARDRLSSIVSVWQWMKAVGKAWNAQRRRGLFPGCGVGAQRMPHFCTPTVGRPRKCGATDSVYPNPACRGPRGRKSNDVRQ